MDEVRRLAALPVDNLSTVDTAVDKPTTVDNSTVDTKSDEARKAYQREWLRQKRERERQP